MLLAANASLVMMMMMVILIIHQNNYDGNCGFWVFKPFHRRDYEGGHGTHVVGSILGNSVPTNYPGFENGDLLKCNPAPADVVGVIVFLIMTVIVSVGLVVQAVIREYAQGV